MKQLAELKLKLQEAERENTAHQGNVSASQLNYAFSKLFQVQISIFGIDVFALADTNGGAAEEIQNERGAI